MSELFSFGLLCLTTFITIMNPLNILPVFMTMTSEFTPQERKQTATKAVLTAFFAMIFFALAGTFVFEFFNITVNAFKVAGGVIFFKMGYDMLNARLTRIKIAKKEIKSYATDISITPLGIPMLCGPGAITNSIILMNQAESLAQKGVLLAAILAICAIALAALYSGSQIIKLIGDTGIKVMMRIMGLILMVIGIEYFMAGLGPMVKEHFLQ